ncbi:MAG TPA: hypothetical protein VFI92_10740, partial [Steroidobacteraceae bacterium]|nr:hypothetical protein [Steroidobacteraceae bacterium]
LRPDAAADGIYSIKRPRSILKDLPLHRGARVPVRLSLTATSSLVAGKYAIEVRQYQHDALVGGIVYEINAR